MNIIPAAKKAIVGVVAVGALSLGAAGVAGAATAGTATPTPATRLANFNCANATKVLDRIQKVEGDIAAGLPKLTAAQAKAAAAGHTRLADRLERRITQLKSATFTNRLDKVASAIEAKCNVPAPSGTAS
jgi:hypothetical protein